MIDYPTAKELAQHSADAEAVHLSLPERYVIVDELAHEHPWGWVFEPAMEPYRSTGEICPRGGAWCLSVDRFSGKIQHSSRAGWRAEQWPILDLHVNDAGSDELSVFRFLREYTNWTASEVRDKLKNIPFVLVSAHEITVAPVATALSGRGATVQLRQKHA